MQATGAAQGKEKANTPCSHCRSYVKGACTLNEDQSLQKCKRLYMLTGALKRQVRLLGEQQGLPQAA